MSSSLTASMQARRHPETTHIDRLATADMLAMLHQDDKQISEAVGACLPDIARLIDIATATISRGGRLVIIGAGASGRTAIEAVSDYSPEGKHALVGLIAGGQTTAMAERETEANNYDWRFELQSLDFSNRDMLLALTVSGKTPWVGGDAPRLVAGRPDSGHHPAADQRGGAAGGYHYCSADRAGGGGGVSQSEGSVGPEADRQYADNRTRHP